jgi:hypothetical protein
MLPKQLNSSAIRIAAKQSRALITCESLEWQLSIIAIKKSPITNVVAFRLANLTASLICARSFYFYRAWILYA